MTCHLSRARLRAVFQGDGRLAAKQFVCCLLIVACCLFLMGCTDKKPSTRGGVNGRQRSGQQGALLGAVTSQLRDLPDANVLELRPPVVILDAAKSSDNQDVMAMVSTHPEAPDPPIYNYVHVPGNNARFRSLGVRSGDIVKLFQMTLAEDREDDEAIAVTVEKATELTVAQVLNDNALLIEGGLTGPSVAPLRIEVWRFVGDREEQINRSINQYILRGDPPLGWEPTPDQYTIVQIVERLNQWLRGIKLDSSWQPTTLVDTLPADVREDAQLAPYLAAGALGRPTFDSYEGRLIQEAIWSRDISRWVRGYETDRLKQAELLFDWVVRNVQLEPDDDPLPRRSWQALVYGRGTAAERAWVFAMLCRQAGFDAVVLTPGTAEETWGLLVGVAVDGQVYLFDPRLGLPVPGPGGEGVATLAQVRDDDALLRQLDTADEKYPLTADNLVSAIVNVVADPFSLARRSALLEERLAGEDAVKLAAQVDIVAERLRGAGIEEVRLWTEPFRSLQRQLELGRQDRVQMAKEFVMFAWRPELWKARTLHFRGKLETPETTARDVLADPIDDHRDAKRLYMSKSVRPTDVILQQQSSSEKQEFYSRAKACATYWLGLLNFDDAGQETSRLENALRWFEMTPQQLLGKELWDGGARYNTARTLRRLGRTEAAGTMLRGDDSPQRQGNQILARQWEAEPGDQSAVTTEDSGK